MRVDRSSGVIPELRKHGSQSFSGGGGALREEKRRLSGNKGSARRWGKIKQCTCRKNVCRSAIKGRVEKRDVLFICGGKRTDCHHKEKEVSPLRSVRRKMAVVFACA